MAGQLPSDQKLLVRLQPSQPRRGSASTVTALDGLSTQTTRCGLMSKPSGRLVGGHKTDLHDDLAFDAPPETAASLRRAERPTGIRNRGQATRQPEERSTDSGTVWRRRLIALFIVSLVIPWVFPIGSARMSVYRLTLCVTLLPSVFLWVSGRSGKMRIADFAVILFSCWRAVSFLVVDGTVAAQAIGISFVETLGAYFLARSCVRTAEDFRAMASTLFVVIAVMLPFALLEATTGQRIILKVFATLLSTYQDSGMELRSGLARVQGPFDHFILFGTFCSSGFALTFLAVGYRGLFIERYGKAGIVAFTAALSLSAGPVLGIVIQCLLIAAKRLGDVIGARFLGVITLSAYLAAQVIFWASNRSLIEFLLGKLTFDPMSYWSRSLIFEYARLSAANHPLFGTGMGRWDRPVWMPPSIDNCWLAFAVMNGIPSAVLLGLAALASVVSVGWKRGLDEKQAECRAAYVIIVLNWCLIGMTVTYWDSTYALILLLLGSGIWILNVNVADATKAYPKGHPRSLKLRRTRTLPVDRGLGASRYEC